MVCLLDLRSFRAIGSVTRILTVAVSLVMISVFSLNYVFGTRLYIEAASAVNNGSIIIIDAGHGGEDSGAVSASGVYEKDLNLQIANMLGECLEKAGFAVVYTRREDKLLYTEWENVKGIRKISDLKNRVAIAADYPNAIFVSIHMNSYGDAKYSGFQAYYKSADGCRSLADKIQSSVRENLQPDNHRVIKEGKGIYVLEKCPIDAVLLECGFLTNEEECEKLCEKEYQKQLCFSIVCGIIEYKKQLD